MSTEDEKIETTILDVYHIFFIQIWGLGLILTFLSNCHSCQVRFHRAENVDPDRRVFKKLRNLIMKVCEYLINIYLFLQPKRKLMMTVVIDVITNVHRSKVTMKIIMNLKIKWIIWLKRWSPKIVYVSLLHKIIKNWWLMKNTYVYWPIEV